MRMLLVLARNVNASAAAISMMAAPVIIPWM